MVDMLTRLIESLGIAKAVFLAGAGLGFAAGLTVGAVAAKFVTVRK